MSCNDGCPSGNFGEILKLSNWIFDSGPTCHMMPEVSDFIPASLKDRDKHIEVADRHHVTTKKGQVQIKMCNNNRDTFITTLHNALLIPYLCDRAYSIITLMDKLVYPTKGFAQKKHAFLVKINEKSKTKKLPSRKKIALKLSHQ